MGTKLKQEETEELLNKLPGMLYRCKYDKDWTMEFVSDGCENLTGYKKSELLYNTKVAYGELIHASDADWVFEFVSKALDAKKTFSYEYRIVTKSGDIKWVWEQGLGIYNNEGQLIDIEGFITDITSQKDESDKLKKELSQKDREILINLALLNEYKKAVDESAIVSKTDRKGNITYVNDAFCKVSEYSEDELLGHSHNIVRHPQNPKATFEKLWDTILSKRIWKGVIKNQTKSGKTYYVKSTIVPILDIDGNIKEFMAIRYDVTDLILQERKIKFQTTDHLTQLPNRQKLLEDLEKGNNLKLAILNIERFKEVNEYYGYDVGDRLLIELSTMLLKELASYQTRVYKLPGDEFAILSDSVYSKDEFRSMIKTIINHIKNFDFQISGNNFNISIVAGASMQKNYFINAEMATHHAKNIIEEFVFFDDNLEIKEQLLSNIDVTQKIKEAIAEDRIVVFAQPLILNSNGAIKKYECLVRMKDKDGTIISPAEFLSVAKKAKLYPQITRIIIDKAIDYFKDKDVEFSINFCLEDIQNKQTVELLKSKINQNPAVGNRIVLEIVEDEGIENDQEVSSFIENMRFLGCKIAIDDFGTGYSNFDYLMRLNVDFIKIDGSIIKNIIHDKNAKVVSELIIDFAKRLNIKTIAEFVYNKETYEYVKNMGVDYSQGYYLGKPEPIE